MTGRYFIVIDNNKLLAEFYNAIGDANHNLKQHSKSDDAYEETLKLKPNASYIMNNYARQIQQKEMMQGLQLYFSHLQNNV